MYNGLLKTSIELTLLHSLQLNHINIIKNITTGLSTGLCTGLNRCSLKVKIRLTSIKSFRRLIRNAIPKHNDVPSYEVCWRKIKENLLVVTESITVRSQEAQTYNRWSGVIFFPPRNVQFMVNIIEQCCNWTSSSILAMEHLRLKKSNFPLNVL